MLLHITLLHTAHLTPVGTRLVVSLNEARRLGRWLLIFGGGYLVTRRVVLCGGLGITRWRRKRHCSQKKMRGFRRSTAYGFFRARRKTDKMYVFSPRMCPVPVSGPDRAPPSGMACGPAPHYGPTKIGGCGSGWNLTDRGSLSPQGWACSNSPNNNLSAPSHLPCFPSSLPWVLGATTLTCGRTAPGQV